MDGKTYITAELLETAASDIGINTNLIFTEVKDDSEVSILKFGGVETKLTKKMIHGSEAAECLLTCYPGFYSEKIEIRTRPLGVYDNEFLTWAIYDTTLRKVYSLPWVAVSVITVMKLNIDVKIDCWLQYQGMARFVVTKKDGSEYTFDIEECETDGEGTVEFILYDTNKRKQLLRTVNQYDVTDVIKQLRLGIYKAIGIQVLD